MTRKERIKRVVHMLLDKDTLAEISELIREDPMTREALVEWMTALATPVSFGKYGRKGWMLGEVYLLDEPYLRWMVKEFGTIRAGETVSPVVEAARLLLHRGRNPLKTW